MNLSGTTPLDLHARALLSSQPVNKSRPCHHFNHHRNDAPWSPSLSRLWLPLSKKQTRTQSRQTRTTSRWRMRFLRSSTLLLTLTPSVSHPILLEHIRTTLTRSQLPTCPRLQLLHTLHPSVLPLFLARRTTRLRLTDHHAHRSLRQPSPQPRTAMLTKTSLLLSCQLLSQLSTRPSLHLLCVPRSSAPPPFVTQEATRLCHANCRAHRVLRQSSHSLRTTTLVKTSLLSSFQLLSQLSIRPCLHLLCVPRSPALQLSLAYKATSLRYAYHHSLRSLHRPIPPLRTTTMAARPLSTSQLILQSGTSLSLPVLPRASSSSTTRSSATMRSGMLHPQSQLKNWNASAPPL